MSFSILPYASPWALQKAKASRLSRFCWNFFPQNPEEQQRPLSAVCLCPKTCGSCRFLQLFAALRIPQTCASVVPEIERPQIFSFSHFPPLVPQALNKLNCLRGSTKSLVNHPFPAVDQWEKESKYSLCLIGPALQHCHAFKPLHIAPDVFEDNLLRSVKSPTLCGPWVCQGLCETLNF